MRRVVAVVALVGLGLVLASCAADTDPATKVTPNGATLNAHGHTDSSAAQFWFAYAANRADLGTSREFMTRAVNVPAGVSGPNGRDLPFGSRTGMTLRPDTTYSFRVCGHDARIPSVCGNTRSLKTPPNPDVNLKTKEYAGSLSVATADFNRDGILDLVTAGASLNGFEVRFGNGNGDFGSPVSVGGPVSANALAAGDFNRDGKKDIAYSGSSGVKLLLGNGSGGFSSGPQTSTSCGIAEARDVNRDGKLDLVGIVVISRSTFACVLFGDGAGGFTDSGPPWIDGGEGPVAVSVGDVTRDGRPDLVVATVQDVIAGGPSGVSVLPGLANNTFGPPRHTSLPDGSFPLGIVLADFNRDGILDAVVSGWLLAGKPDGTLAAPVPVPNLPTVLAAGDLDGNGTQDLITERSELVDPTDGSRGEQLIFRVLPGKGDGSFKAPNDVPVVNPGRPSSFVQTSRSLLVADFDRDGRPDLATAGNFVTGSTTSVGFLAVGLNTTAG